MKTHSSQAAKPGDKIRALIKLLGDDDPEIRKIARDNLLISGRDAVPYLEEIIRTDVDGKTRIEARALLHKIRQDELVHAFHLLALWKDEQIDLEDGAFLLARFAYPELAKSDISAELDRLADRIAGLLSPGMKPRRIVQMINNVLFTEAGFSGNRENYYLADNSYLNIVLRRKTGIPISLSMIYILIARRLRLPIYGVNMPMHFLCKYDTIDEPFYIDAFDLGRVLTYTDCILLLKSYGVDFNKNYMKRASNRDILSRMLRNLILVYYHNEEDNQADFLKKLLKILKFYARSIRVK